MECIMVLQNIIFPDETICRESVLYYRTEQGDLRVESSGIRMEQGAVCSFFTYFNGFSIGKWREYTAIGSCRIRLQLKGQGRIELCHSILQQEMEMSEIIQVQDFTAGDRQEICMDIPQTIQDGVVYVRILAETESTLYGGCYETETEQARDVRIAVGICTYRREPFVQKTLDTFQTTFLQNKSSFLFGKLKIYVSDNGNTLDHTAVSDENITCVPNKNAGGAGGFTRCMLEALKEQEERGFTHFLFMDDDIILEPEALYRTYMLLALAREPYQDAAVGGALLRLDLPTIQHANGENWNSGHLNSPKRGYDFTRKTDLLRNEVILPEEYQGWWYCCIPFGEECAENLPLPVFIHFDDIEYSLRFAGKWMHLNGVGIWHDAFDHRRASSMEYYDMRNLLITNAIHNKQYGWKQARKKIFRHMVFQLLKYRYRDTELTIRSVEDFCKGVCFLETQEPIALHQEIMEMGYPFADQTEQLKERKPDWEMERPDRVTVYKEEKRGLKHILSLNGWLLPGKRGTEVLPMGVHPNCLYRVKRVLYYDPESGKGFESKRTYREIFRLLRDMYRINRLLHSSYDTAAADYRQNYRRITNITFWNRYLELK